ncbi:hypothetical protein HPCU_04915 [Helicobacter pylori Cuz20]|uniref:Uncharacterized protein n=1 Tax=Helicobacter pylori (strain Cuz20) TaxID=765964 RepID=A0AB32X889_HELPC|nr:hypothetical protein HPCU_04915 [Helicobacter pylori Cuz20]
MKEVQTFESFNQDLADSVGGFLENPLAPRITMKIIV